MHYMFLGHAGHCLNTVPDSEVSCLLIVAVLCLGISLHIARALHAYESSQTPAVGGAILG